MDKELKRRKRISNLKHQICIMMDEITYAQKMLNELENGGDISDSDSDSDSEDEPFYLDNVNGVYISDSDSEDEHFYLDNINGV
jgi:hypothetical protein